MNSRSPSLPKRQLKRRKHKKLLTTYSTKRYKRIKQKLQVPIPDPEDAP